MDAFSANKLTDYKIISLAAYFTIEQILSWLASLEEEERSIFLEGLDTDEKANAIALTEAFYLSSPEVDRTRTNSEALKLLNSAWQTKSQIWLTRRWDALSRLLATVAATWSKKKFDADADIGPAVETILRSLRQEDGVAPKAVMERLVSFVRALGFKGIVVLVDKVDETPQTSNSSDATARLVYPILEHVQLMEVEGFSWLFFLWSDVQQHYETTLRVRLDKITPANITWTEAGLREMIDSRMKFFSASTVSFDQLFDEGSFDDSVFSYLCHSTVKSPRELIKAVDIIVREHDLKAAPGLVDRQTVETGLDKYSLETINFWFPRKFLQQVYRVGKTEFTNKDVASKYKITTQAAGRKIAKWQELGLVKQEGTFASETGNKPVYRYEVADPRVERIIGRMLDKLVGSDVDEQEDNEEVI